MCVFFVINIQIMNIKHRFLTPALLIPRYTYILFYFYNSFANLTNPTTMPTMHDHCCQVLFSGAPYILTQNREYFANIDMFIYVFVLTLNMNGMPLFLW